MGGFCLFLNSSFVLLYNYRVQHKTLVPSITSTSPKINYNNILGCTIFNNALLSSHLLLPFPFYKVAGIKIKTKTLPHHRRRAFCSTDDLINVYFGWTIKLHGIITKKRRKKTKKSRRCCCFYYTASSATNNNLTQDPACHLSI